MVSVIDNLLGRSDSDNHHPVADRVFACEHCAQKIGRDRNAAINLA
ncbi:hypothetical protein EF294_20710 [Gordonia oryzae]|uniref:Uncharacterized protein n=1 Tax=Gordonia oryzae TaxID=2487349 RepID=A0A3N4GV07_9ACTN|nr:hypothetical protein EF294_20710 [Gordonia oryzae]